jgi:hypothetical protein
MSSGVLKEGAMFYYGVLVFMPIFGLALSLVISQSIANENKQRGAHAAGR